MNNSTHKELRVEGVIAAVAVCLHLGPRFAALAAQLQVHSALALVAQHHLALHHQRCPVDPALELPLLLHNLTSAAQAAVDARWFHFGLLRLWAACMINETKESQVCTDLEAGSMP